jgi:hypothetical protein
MRNTQYMRQNWCSAETKAGGRGKGLRGPNSNARRIGILDHPTTLVSQ